MTSSRDPIEVPAAGEPPRAELDESDRRLDQLSSDSSNDPVVRLLRAASAAPTEDELVDRVGFAAIVARAATLTPDAPVRSGPTTELPGLATDAPQDGRLTHVRRVLTTKVAIITGMTVLGLAGAGAATGAYRTATSAPDRPTTTTTTSVDVPHSTAGSPAANPSDSEDGTSDWLAGPLWPIRGLPADPPDDPALPDDTGSADDGTPDAEGPDDGESPDPGNTGATNGNSPNAGGNPNPGNTGATRRASGSNSA
ncbi:MAG: hypothetical protein M3Y51_04775 [Actinomycetota bacterium]|nr:hypothetical protein [Actinomycetota bacterium]